MSGRTRITVMHLRSSEFFGGPERAILGQCTTMPETDFVCATFVRGDLSNPFLDRARELNLTTATITEKRAGDFKVVRQIRAIVDEHDADLVITHDYKANLFARLALRKTGVPQIVHFRGRTLEDKKVRFYNFIDTLLLRRMPLILTVSEKSATILRQMKVPEDVIRVVPNAIEDSKLMPADMHRMVNPDRPMRFVAAGRLSHEKGYDVLLDALALVPESLPAFEVHIYGHGPEQKRLEEMVERHGLVDTVLFKGFVDNILPVLEDADALVLPSRSEGMPNILLEAWAKKLGSVCTTVGGVPEMMTHKESGLLVPPEDPSALAEQIEWAVTHRDQMIQLGERGYRVVQERYSYSRQGEMLRDIYDRVLAQARQAEQTG